MREVIPSVTAARLSGPGRDELPLLVLGPSLGTAAATLWGACAAGLADVFDVLAWDLPGHGYNTGVAAEQFTISGLARGVLLVVDDVLAQRDEADAPFFYAGNSVGGAVGLQLLLDAPTRVRSAVLLCTGATLGEPAGWRQRIVQVEAAGTAALTEVAPQRWFAPGFAARDADTARGLLQDLRTTKDAGYIQVCRALVDFDVRDRLGEIAAPVLTVAGALDTVTPAPLLEEVAEAVGDGQTVVLPQVAHLAPAEAPAEVARLLRGHLLGEVDDPGTRELEATLARLVAEHPGRSIWTRPGLDQRSRALITLTGALGRAEHDELAAHVRAALGAGLSVEEIEECLMQTVLHGAEAEGRVPHHAHAAFTIARGVFGEERG